MFDIGVSQINEVKTSDKQSATKTSSSLTFEDKILSTPSAFVSQHMTHKSSEKTIIQNIHTCGS
jgi:hypothetical protein